MNIEEKCCILDSEGNHCPEKPSVNMFVDGVQMILCYKCYLNVLAGAYAANKPKESVKIL